MQRKNLERSFVNKKVWKLHLLHLASLGHLRRKEHLRYSRELGHYRKKKKQVCQLLYVEI